MSDWIQLNETFPTLDYDKVFGQKDDKPNAFDLPREKEDPDILFDRNFDQIDWSNKCLDK